MVKVVLKVKTMTPNLNHLAETLNETATLHQLCLNLYSEPAITSHTNRTGTTSSPHSTMQEQWVNTREHMTNQWERIETTAAELSWRGIKLDGDPARFIATRLPWAQTNYPYMPKLAETITEIHAYFQNLARENDQTSSHLCPACGQTQLKYRDQDQQFYCTECDGTWDTQTLTIFRTYRIVNSGEWITIKEAAHRYRLTTERIRQWIHRGKIHRDTQKRVNSIEIENLLKCDT